MDRKVKVSKKDRLLLYLHRAGFEVKFGYVDNGCMFSSLPGKSVQEAWWMVDYEVVMISKGGKYLVEIDPSLKLRMLENDDSPSLREAVNEIHQWKFDESEMVDLRALAHLKLIHARCHMVHASPCDIGRSHAESALSLCEEVLSLDPTLAPAWNCMGAILVRLERKDEGLRCYAKAVEFDPSLLRAWHNLGNRYAEKNQSKRAHKAYAKAAGLEPNEPHDWVLKASAMLKIGDFRGAVRCAEHALRLFPHDSWAADILKDAKVRLS
jgi:tetratricopeptide (TPR) repeat protein